MTDQESHTPFEELCLEWQERILTGEYAHLCPDWDGLPIDETCGEFACCTCYDTEPDALLWKKERMAELDAELEEYNKDSQMYFMWEEWHDEE